MPRLAGCLLLLLVSLASGDFTRHNEELSIRSLSSPYRRLQVRPVASPSDQIKISIGMSLLDADVNEADNKVTLGGWVKTGWTDRRLAWSGDTVKSSRVSPKQVWKPDISVYTRVPVTSPWVGAAPVMVHHSGDIIFAPPMSFTVRCQRHQTDDQDRITCPFKIGSWTHSVQEMDLVPDNSTLDTSEFLNNGRWVVESSSLVREEKVFACCSEAFVIINGEVVLKQQRY